MCTPGSPRLPSSFAPAADGSLFHPTSLLDSLSLLSSAPSIFSSENPYVLHINRLHYDERSNGGNRRSKTSVAAEDTCVTVLPSSHRAASTTFGRQSGLVVGNSVALAHKEAEKDEAMKHEINKAAWIERHAERIEKEKQEREEQKEHEEEGNEYGEVNAYRMRGDSLCPPMSFLSRPVSRSQQSTVRVLNCMTCVCFYCVYFTHSRSHSHQVQPITNSSRQPQQERPQSGRNQLHTRRGTPTFHQTTTDLRRKSWAAEHVSADRGRFILPTSNYLGHQAGAAHPRAAPPVPAPAQSLPAYVLALPLPMPTTLAPAQAPSIVSPTSVLAAGTSEVILVDAVAPAEAATMNSMRAAQAFYTSHTSSTSSTARLAPIRPSPDPSAQRLSHPLMLYRDPPHWRIMQTPPQPERSSRTSFEDGEETAATNRHRKKARTHVEGMQNIISKRLSTTGQADAFQQRVQVNATTSRNPFIQRSGGKEPAQIKAIKTLLSVASNTSAVQSIEGRTLSSPAPLKSLKPISGLGAPLLPRSAISAPSNMKEAQNRSGSLKSLSTRLKDNSEVAKKKSVTLPASDMRSGRPSSAKDGTGTKLKPPDSTALWTASARSSSTPRPAKKSSSAIVEPPRSKKEIVQPAAKKKGFGWEQWAK